MRRDARISECGRYRYALLRAWGEGSSRPMVVLGLNPSKAGAEIDDRTSVRVVGFANGFGHDNVVMLNPYAFRATKPKDMMAAADPVGPQNDEWIRYYTHPSWEAVIVLAWGAHPFAAARAAHIVSLLEGQKTYCLDRNQDGSPKHPLYIAADAQLKEWTL